MKICFPWKMVGEYADDHDDDGTVWQVYMDAFETVEHIIVKK